MKSKKITDLVNFEWGILCTQAVIDKDSNNLSLSNVIEKFNFEGELADKSKTFDSQNGELIPVNFVFVSRYRKLVDINKKLEVDVGFDFTDPDKRPLGEFQNTITMDKGIDSFRMRFVVNGMKVTRSGLYFINVKVRQKGSGNYVQVGSVPLEVNLKIK